MPDLRADYCFSLHFSIEPKTKSARRVLNRFIYFETEMKENFLSYLVIFVFCCQSGPSVGITNNNVMHSKQQT